MNRSVEHTTLSDRTSQSGGIWVSSSFANRVQNDPYQAKMCLRFKCGQRRPRSDCAFAQSDLGLHSPLTESVNTKECMNEHTLRMRRMRLSACTGWSEFVHFAHVRGQFFAWRDPNDTVANICWLRYQCFWILLNITRCLHFFVFLL